MSSKARSVSNTTWRTVVADVVADGAPWVRSATHAPESTASTIATAAIRRMGRA